MPKIIVSSSLESIDAERKWFSQKVGSAGWPGAAAKRASDGVGVEDTWRRVISTPVGSTLAKRSARSSIFLFVQWESWKWWWEEPKSLRSVAGKSQVTCQERDDLTAGWDLNAACWYILILHWNWLLNLVDEFRIINGVSKRSYINKYGTKNLEVLWDLYHRAKISDKITCSS